MEFDEKKFVSQIKPHLMRCREGDWGHAQRTVALVKELGAGREDLPLLIIAGYVHDLGWRDVVCGKKLSLEEILHFEPRANANTEPFISEVLGGIGYSQQEIKTVIRLVHAADAHEGTRDDELIIVDADNLSKLTIDHLKEKFRPDTWLEMVDRWEENLPKRIHTEQGKELYPRLLQRLKEAVSRQHAGSS